jgi:hypothetical protein
VKKHFSRRERVVSEEMDDVLFVSQLYWEVFRESSMNLFFSSGFFNELNLIIKPTILFSQHAFTLLVLTYCLFPFWNNPLLLRQNLIHIGKPFLSKTLSFFITFVF